MVDKSMSYTCSRCGDKHAYYEDNYGNHLCDTCYHDSCSRCHSEYAYHYDDSWNRLCDTCYYEFENAKERYESCSRCGAANAEHFDDNRNRLCDACYYEFVNAKADARANEARSEVLQQHGLAQRSGGGCFIATAAYGTPIADEINTLRRFRNDGLQPNRLGRHLVTLYYDVSPRLARVIAQSEGMRAFIRLVLKPIVSYFKSRSSQ